MISVKEIRELRDYLVNTYHSNRIKEQETDETYYRDTFNVPWVQDKALLVRTGKGARMVDAPAEHIITGNPQYFRERPLKKNADADGRVASECNKWLQILLTENPQPFKQAVKYLLRRGGSWIYVIHNQDFDGEDLNDMPVELRIFDPLIMFSDPEVGEKNGVPGRLVVSFERRAGLIKKNYPFWTWKNQRGRDGNNKVPFFMYWDNETRYFEADQEALLTDSSGNTSNGDGLQENIYGFVPFVHFYSGLGSDTLESDPADLEVGRLRFVRDLLAEQCAIRSVLNTLIHKYAHKPFDLLYDPAMGTPSGDIGEKYSRELNAFNQIGLPTGATLKAGEDMLPDPQLFQHLYNIEQQINQEDPLGLVSTAIGTSGRQQDLATEASLRRYDTIVENTARAFGTAIGMGLRMVEKLPDLLPPGLKKDDIGGYYEGRVELKADDPIEEDRLRTLGSRLWQMGEIDLETNLTRYQGYTTEESQQIMAKILVDNATRNNPIIAQVMGMQAAREIGMEQEYQQLLAQAQEAGKNPEEAMMMPGAPQTGARGGAPREGNIQSETGREMMDMSLAQRGARRSPTP